MEYVVTCECGQKMAVSDAAIDRIGRCVSCGRRIRITRDRLELPPLQATTTPSRQEMVSSKAKRRVERKTATDAEEQVGGTIAYHGLQNWWLSTFTSQERQYMEQAFEKVGHEHFTKGKPPMSHSLTAAGYLNAMLSHFPTKRDSIIAARILDKAEELSLSGSRILDLHFAYMYGININYRNRDTDEKALDKAIEYCEKQISIAKETAVAFLEMRSSGLPIHTGFKQLAIIREKQGDLEEAIALCEEAKRHGWGQGMTRGPEDWDKRIERYKKRLGKQGTK